MSQAEKSRSRIFETKQIPMGRANTVPNLDEHRSDLPAVETNRTHSPRPPSASKCLRSCCRQNAFPDRRLDERFAREPSSQTNANLDQQVAAGGPLP